MGGLVTWAEVLAEVMGQRAGRPDKHRRRRVVAHRADRLLAVLDQGIQQQVQIFA
jgi:hypothetical protein